jgi:enolase-phosphatase E1
MTSRPSAVGIHGILLDIEGTTTPIAFVHDVLFSYARSRVRDYLIENSGSVDLLADLAELCKEYAADLKADLQPPAGVDQPQGSQTDSMVAYIHWLIDQDRKSTGLKSLQGKIWKQGYLDGTLKAQLFADVAPALQRWRDAGLKISIFSSGSSLAQQLLFTHTDAGDLSSFIDNYFDTRVGSKVELESYRQIAGALNLPASEVLFISDIVSELAAASDAGMHTLLCVRPGNHPQSLAASYQTIKSFDEV